MRSIYKTIGIGLISLSLILGSSEKRSKQNDLTTKVNEAIEILAPHFGIREEELLRYERPRVFYIAEETPMFRYSKSKYQLIFGRGTDFGDIGHEVAHWLHFNINPEIFYVEPKVINLFERKVFTEALANIAGYIVATEKGEEPSDDERESFHDFSEYNLRKLARMDIREAENITKGVGYGGNKLHKYKF